MSIYALHNLVEAAERAGLEYVLVGGYAVIAYGHERSTSDVDLLVGEEQVGAWRKFLQGLGYRPFQENTAFHQFLGVGKMPPLDLLLVDQKTWAKLQAGSQRRSISGREVLTASPLHLIALKLHAISQNPSREGDDRTDIDAVIREQKIDVRNPEFREIVLRYAGAESYARFLQDHPSR